jgi:hypothetical protein
MPSLENPNGGSARTSETLSSLSDLGEKSKAVAAGNAVDTTTNAMKRVSTNPRSQSLDDLLEATGDFAAQHPVAFLGCGIAIGFFASQLLTSPQRREARRKG